jgi:undecaprenyl-diphosphatase
MTIIAALILGLLQGLTEFLPVSSSGHLAVAEKLFGFGGEESVAFDVLIHLATLVAIFIVVFRDIIGVLKTDRKVIVMLVIGSIPAGAAGFLLKDEMDVIKSDLLLVGAFFLVTAAFLVMSRFLAGKQEKELGGVTVFDAAFIGMFQAAAVLPGVSRSGSTIAAGRMSGLCGRAAFAFSFLLGAIAISGASLLKAKDMAGLGSTIEPAALAAAFAGALVSGIAAMLALRKIVISGKLHYFAFYLVPLGILTMILHFILGR